MSNRNPRKAVLSVISKLELVDSNVFGLTATDRRLIRDCLDKEIVTDVDFKEFLHIRLLELGRENFQRLFIPGRYPNPDRAPSVVAFAYAIEHEVLTDKELEKVRFDFGDTTETYLLQERRGLLDTVMDKLVSA